MWTREKWRCSLAGLLGLLGTSLVAHSAPESWEALDAFHGTLTRGQLEARLDTVYAPHADWRSWIELTEADAWIRTDADQPHRFYRLALRQENGSPELPRSNQSPEKPLEAWRIAIDPGHIGGEWGPMERRSFRIGNEPVVQEGDLVLAAAHRLAEKLRERGAEVVLVREQPEPLTSERAADFYLQAFRDLLHADTLPPMEDVRSRAEALFYRGSEIEARAWRVNTEIQPDLVIALHIDAAAWPEGDTLVPVEQNGGHILVNGAYMEGELRRDGMRRAMLWRLLSGYSETEVRFATGVAESMAEKTGLPPVTYRGKNAARVNSNAYVWARNLLANRIYDAPVIYLEPWTLNNASVYAWAQYGDYEGTREIGGEPRASLPAVYADFVFEGLLRAFE